LRVGKRVGLIPAANMNLFTPNITWVVELGFKNLGFKFKNLKKPHKPNLGSFRFFYFYCVI